jgi:hypothetical protein
MQPCPLCKSSPLNKPYYSNLDWMVLRCSKCTFAWVVDLTKPQESTAFSWDMEIVEESGKRFRMYRDRLTRINSFRPDPAVWLDVGCGGGGMLRCAQEAGYEVEGIELSESGRSISSRYGIPIHSKTLTESLNDLQHESYGVVSYFHVLEHVLSPVSELLAARQLLGDRNLLVVEVPYFDTLSWKIFRQKHRHFFREHRSYFNIKSLNTLLNLTGFSVLKADKVPMFMSIGWALMRLQNSLHVNLNALRDNLPRFVSERTFRFDFRDVLMVVATKNSAKSG